MACCCGNPCPDPQKCGANCCTEGETCCNGVTCCAPGQTCCESQCCNSDQLCCGGNCCAPNQFCCGGVCCESPAICCDDECCDLSGCEWQFDCDADDADELTGGCIKVVSGAYDVGVNNPSQQMSSIVANPVPFPWSDGYLTAFGSCPHITLLLTRNANCETTQADNSKGGGEVTETQYIVLRSDCSGTVTDVTADAVDTPGVTRFEPDPPCTLPADPPLLDWLSYPSFVCPP